LFRFAQRRVGFALNSEGISSLGGTIERVAFGALEVSRLLVGNLLSTFRTVRVLNSGHDWASHWLATVTAILILLVLVTGIAFARILQSLVLTSPMLATCTTAMPIAILGLALVDLDARFQMSIEHVHLEAFMAIASVAVSAIYAIATSAALGQCAPINVDALSIFRHCPISLASLGKCNFALW
jgi:hypothetical protein